MEAFWCKLEARAATYHLLLLERLNDSVKVLSQRVESTTNEVLQMKLVPLDISVLPPSPDELHSDVKKLIENGAALGQGRDGMYVYESWLSCIGAAAYGTDPSTSTSCWGRAPRERKWVLSHQYPNSVYLCGWGRTAIAMRSRCK